MIGQDLQTATTRTKSRRLRLFCWQSVAMVSAMLVVATITACASNDTPPAIPGAESPRAEQSTDTLGSPTTTGSISDAAASAPASNDSTSTSETVDEGDPHTTPSSTDGPHVVVDPSDLPAMNVVAALGYPRDLLDRGRVNVKISREGDADFVIFDKQLLADYFTPAPVEQRRTLLPSDGRVVALQTLFGEVADCESTDPLTASLMVTFTYGDDPTVKTTAIPFTDTATLDQIRIQKCIVEQVLDENEIELDGAVVDGETMTVNLVIRRREGESRLGFDSIKGTVLFGVATRFEPGTPERTLEPDETEAVIPLVVDVNRCDSHAVAETTRKFGLDLYVSVDGSDSQLIQVPVTEIESDLDAMLELCKERTGQ